MKKTLLFLLFLLSTGICLADWPVKKGRIQLIPSYNLYYSSSYFNSNGKVTSLNGGHFTSHYFSMYGMYGITDRLDFLVNLPITFQSLSSGGVKYNKSGISDISVGLAYHFPTEDMKKYFTVKGFFIFPAYQNNVTPYLGYASRAFQLAAAYSYNPNDKSYLAVEGNYTRYVDDNNGPSQFLFSGTFGYYLNTHEKLTINFTHQISISDDKVFSANLPINKDFYVGKIALGYGKRISRTVTPYIQAYFTPYGYNAGNAIGINLFAIIKIP